MRSIYAAGRRVLARDSGEGPLEFPIEDAIANMRVIDAAFRSARGGGWERP